MSTKRHNPPTPGEWFDLASRFVDVIEIIGKAADKIAEFAEKRYELERNKIL